MVRIIFIIDLILTPAQQAISNHGLETMVYRPLESIGLTIALQSHPPVTGVLKWEIHESALGSAPGGAQGNRGAPVLPRVLREIGGAPGSAPESAQRGASTQQTEHSRDHFLEHPQFP